MRGVKTGLMAVLLGWAGLFGAPVLHAATLSMQEAIAKVERETHGKVLSAETKRSGSRSIYRIKVLTRDGRVQVIEVPADA